MKTRLKYIVLLTILLTAMAAPGERHYPLPGNNRFMEVLDSIKAMPDGSQEREMYENIIAFNYADSCVLVVTGSVDLFLHETYEFEHGIDAIKYWYDRGPVDLYIQDHDHSDTTNSIAMRKRVAEDKYNTLFYYNGDWNKDGFHSTLTDAEIFNNSIRISKPLIGWTINQLIDHLNLAYPVNPDGIVSVELMGITFKKAQSNNYCGDAAFIFNCDTIQCITTGHPGPAYCVNFLI